MQVRLYFREGSRRIQKASGKNASKKEILLLSSGRMLFHLIIQRREIKRGKKMTGG
jgi:hypothetical protein